MGTKSERDKRIEDEPPIGMLPNGELAIFNTVEEARQWRNDHPEIVVKPEDDSDLPEDFNRYDNL